MHYGIDVSEWNGNMSFLSLDPVPEFVILRASYGTHVDKKAEAYRLQLENINIPYGVYVYSYALNCTDARKEAEFVLNLIKEWNVQLGVWIDMEDADNYKANHGVTGPHMISAICDIFCSVVEEAGYFTGIYASRSWFSSKIIGLQRFDHWVADWGWSNDGTQQTNTSAYGTIQQYSSTKGTLDKDCTYVPLSVYNVHPPYERKPLDEYVREVWLGNYGNGSARKKALSATPYGYKKIQSRVDDYAKWARKYSAPEYHNLLDIGAIVAAAAIDPDVLKTVMKELQYDVPVYL